MKTILLAGALAASLPASPQGADKVACAAKPFTLGKTAQPTAKATPEAVKKAAPAVPAQKPAKPLADCKKKPGAG